MPKKSKKEEKKKKEDKKKGKRGKKAKNSIVVKNNAGPNIKQKKKHSIKPHIICGPESPRSRQFQQTNDLIVEVAVDSIACGDRRMRKRVEASDLRGPEFELSRPLKLYCINLLFLVTKTMKRLEPIFRKILILLYIS